MPKYNLKIMPHGETLSEHNAVTREHALELFGKRLGVSLTFQANDPEPPYKMDEWEVGDEPHFVNPHIPVYKLA